MASLFVGRLTGRQKEIAIRESLGATRAELVRQFLTESAIFSGLAGVIGGALAYFALQGIRLAVAQQVPPNTVFALNWRAMAFIAGTALMSAVLVGLIPALHASKAGLVDTLKDGRLILPLPQRPLAGLNVVSEDYFATMRIPIVMGRAFTAQDRTGAPGVCIINQSLATHVFPGESPLGHVLLRGRDAEIAQTIVGVIADVKTNGLSAPAPDEVYYAMRQLGKPALNVVARTTGDTAALQGAIRAAVAQVDHDQPISFFQSLDAALAQSLGVQRIVATLTACFAALALVLAAVGLYSVVAYAVTQRTGEIGIRMALGARPGQVLALIMRGGLRLVAIGLAIGLAGAAWTARLIQTLLSNVHPLDPMVYGSVAVFFGIVAALACLLPSVRASRIDPLVALGDRRTTR